MKKTFIKITCFLALFLSASKFNGAMAQVQSDTVAIDILLNPDQIMIDSAKAYNQLMKQNYSGPGSFSLDATHTPHVSVLQCFVLKSSLEKVFAAVEQVVKSTKPTSIKLTASAFYYLPDKSLGLAGITAKATPELLAYQSKIIAAVKPFIVVGTNSAFVQNPNGKPIAAGVQEYVNAFIPKASGAKFNPHVTIGLAKKDFLDALKAKPFNTFTFGIASASIYHLGDYGTAQKKLWTSKK